MEAGLPFRLVRFSGPPSPRLQTDSSTLYASIFFTRICEPSAQEAALHRGCEARVGVKARCSHTAVANASGPLRLRFRQPLIHQSQLGREISQSQRYQNYASTGPIWTSTAAPKPAGFGDGAVLDRFHAWCLIVDANAARGASD